MKTELIVPISEFRILRDFMPEWNEPTGDSKTTIVDWSTLMHVVGKITPLANHMGQQAWFDVKYSLMNASIESVYKRVIEFIKWYNSVISPTGKVKQKEYDTTKNTNQIEC